MSHTVHRFSRRAFLTVTAAASCQLAAPAIAQTAEEEDTGPVRRNMMGFRAHTWQPYFDTLQNGAILVDTESRALHFWSEDESVRLIFPTSVPLSEEMTRRGRTKVVKKVVGPSWTPTPSMRRRDPELPISLGPGPDNPLGTHALYLSWKYYRIHGTHDTRKIGRQSSSGCVGLYNEDIATLFELAQVGTQVLLI